MGCYDAENGISTGRRWAIPNKDDGPMSGCQLGWQAIVSRCPDTETLLRKQLQLDNRNGRLYGDDRQGCADRSNLRWSNHRDPDNNASEREADRADLNAGASALPSM